MMHLPGANLSKEFFELVKAIGESRSKQEEDRIVINEVQTLKKSISAPSVSSKRMKEYLVRSVYVEMLGHDASFAHIHAVNLAQQKDILCKRMGYLAASLCLPNTHELLLLLINTIQRDMTSPNFLEVSAALTCVCRLLNSEMIPAIRPIILRLLGHGNESVRKKAVMALHRLYQLQPHDTAQEAQDCVRRALCDPDASVRGASLHLLHELMQHDRDSCKDLTPALVSMLKQIVDHRLPRDYDYHRVPAPWMQVKLLSMLGALGAADQVISEQMYEVLQNVMRVAEGLGANVGFAILYECVRTITTIYPHQRLLELAASSITRFITADNHNLQFVGLTGLSAIVKANPAFAAQHQLIVVDCLEDPDETLKRKTLDLLVSMTNPRNVKVIVEKLLSHLKASTDRHLRRELGTKIVQLAERYACDNRWYLDTMNTVFERAGDLLAHEVGYSLIRLIAEGPVGEENADNEFRRYAADSYLELCERLCSRMPDMLARVVSWTLGEYGSLATREGYTVEDICDLLCDLADRDSEDSTTKCWVVSAVMKLFAQNCSAISSSTIESLLARHKASRDADIQQRCHEFIELRKSPKLMRAVLPYDAFCEDINVDSGLRFLETFVQKSASEGARRYLPPEDRPPQFCGSTQRVPANDTVPQRSAPVLRFTPYEAPKKPTGVGSAYGITASGKEAKTDSTKGFRQDTGRQATGVAYNGIDKKNSSDGFHVDGPRRWGPQGYVGRGGPVKSTISDLTGNVAPIPPGQNPAKSAIPLNQADRRISAAGGAEQSEKEKTAAALFRGITPSGITPSGMPSESSPASSAHGVSAASGKHRLRTGEEADDRQLSSAVAVSISPAADISKVTRSSFDLLDDLSAAPLPVIGVPNVSQTVTPIASVKAVDILSLDEVLPLGKDVSLELFKSNLSATELSTDDVARVWPTLAAQNTFRVERCIHSQEATSSDAFFSIIQKSLSLQIVQIVGLEGIAACWLSSSFDTTGGMPPSTVGLSSPKSLTSTASGGSLIFLHCHVSRSQNDNTAYTAQVTAKAESSRTAELVQRVIEDCVAARSVNY